MAKTSIIIPACNEGERIGETLKDYTQFFKDKEVEIIVVLNGCTDNTLEIVKKYNCRILNYTQAGKGFAIVEGFKDALKRNNDYIGFVDADNATKPEAFYDLMKNINDVDGVIANRWDKRSIIKTQQTLLRKIMSKGFNLIVRSLFLFNYRDTQCGAKLFKRKVLPKIIPKLGNSEWAFDIDLLFYVRRNKFKVKSIPTVWENKKGSKINLKKTPIRMFLSVIRLRILHSPFRFLLRVHSKLPKKIRITYWLRK